MLSTLALTLSLLSSPELWQFSRSVIWGMGHDHPSVELDRCIRSHKGSCGRKMRENNRSACRFILKGACKI